MTTRTFELSEGTSNKFWTITLDGSTHTVNYGRIGTNGQTSTAEFASDAEALKSYNKLVAEKLKKGYVEKTGGAAPVPVQPVATRKAPAKTASVQAAPVAAVAAAEPPKASTPSPSVAGNVRREIDLEISAFSYVPSRRAASTPRAPAEPFNLDECLTRLRTKVRMRSYGWEWDFSRVVPERKLDPQEAEFWLTALTLERARDEKPESFVEKLSKRSFHGKLPSKLRLSDRYLSPLVIQCLVALTSAEELCELLLNPRAAQGDQEWESRGAAMRMGFRKFVLPYLDEAAIDKWRAATRARWDPSAWPTKNYYAAGAPVFYLGAMLGLDAEVRALVEQWPDDLYSADPAWDHTHYHRPQEVVYGAGSPQEVAHHFRRLKLPTNSTDDIQTFLAVTDLSALDVIVRSIVATGKKEEAEELLTAFARIHAPEGAPHALELALSSKAPKAAREWLENNLDESILGLMPTVAGTGKLADAATEFLSSVKRRGNASRIETHLASVEPAVAARVRSKVLDVVEVQLPVLALEATPQWWTTALAQAPVKKSKPVAWLRPSDLPAIAIGDSVLGPEHIAELLAVLQASTLEAPHPLLRPLREHAVIERLDAFGWKLLESWLAEGAPPKEKWAFIASGFLGGDRTVLALAPLVRAWPGESQHQRAVLGLEVLRLIGTDTALMQINGIAQKVKFKGLKEKAVQCMDAIAASRGMTRAELEDRIVPDCGLDERGERVFDFGPRQFQFVLGPDLKPMIRYPDRATKSDLPKPNAKDDAAKAAAALAEWKLLKKQIAEVAKIQAVRLEQAMVTGRRWTATEFQQLLVGQPLMVHLVRMLVWASYAPSGALATTFRVTEDRTLGDAADTLFELPPDATVGVLHPLQLADQPQVLAQWGQVFADYEIIAPFPQLGRSTYRLTPEQLAQQEMTQFKSRGQLPAQSLVFGLEKLGWLRGIPADAGWVGEHSKQFHGAKVTAVITYSEGFSVGYWEGAGDQTIERVFFVAGLYTPQMYPDHAQPLHLASVDAIALSEVLGDCELLLTKAK